MDDPQPPPEEPYALPGTTPSWEPVNLPNWPMTAQQALPFIKKVIA